MLISTRREQFDIGLEPNVDVCYGIRNIVSAQLMLREGLRLRILPLYKFLLES